MSLRAAASRSVNLYAEFGEWYTGESVCNDIARRATDRACRGGQPPSGVNALGKSPQGFPARRLLGCAVQRPPVPALFLTCERCRTTRFGCDERETREARRRRSVPGLPRLVAHARSRCAVSGAPVAAATAPPAAPPANCARAYVRFVRTPPAVLAPLTSRSFLHAATGPSAGGARRVAYLAYVRTSCVASREIFSGGGGCPRRAGS